MNETRNPFEEAMKATESESDLFAPSVADLFANAPSAEVVPPAENAPRKWQHFAR